MSKKPVESLTDNLQVLKVQRPLFDSEGEYHKILVYNEDRSIDGETVIGPGACGEIFRNGEHKVFVRGKMLGTKVYMHEILPEEQWPEW